MEHSKVNSHHRKASAEHPQFDRIILCICIQQYQNREQEIKDDKDNDPSSFLILDNVLECGDAAFKIHICNRLQLFQKGHAERKFRERHHDRPCDHSLKYL